MPVTCNPSYRNSVQVRKRSPWGWRAGTAVPLAHEAQVPEEARSSKRGRGVAASRLNLRMAPWGTGKTPPNPANVQRECAPYTKAGNRDSQRGLLQNLTPWEMLSKSWFSNQLPSIQRKKEFKEVTEVCNNALGDRCRYKSLRASPVPGWAMSGTQLTDKHPAVPWKKAGPGEVPCVFHSLEVYEGTNGVYHWKTSGKNKEISYPRTPVMIYLIWQLEMCPKEQGNLAIWESFVFKKS